MTEPGLDLHEWTTRWEQLLEVAEEAPADAVGELGRLLEEMLRERGLLETENDARKQLEAARDLERRYERDGDLGDLAESINAYRELFDALVAEYEIE